MLGELGAFEVTGSGERPMILVPGLGFGAEIFRTLTEAWRVEYTMHAVTLAGFGGTAAAPPTPTPTSFGEQTWADAAVDAVQRLMLDENLDGAIVVGYWLGGTQVAVRLAQWQPERIEAIVAVGGFATDGSGTGGPVHAAALDGGADRGNRRESHQVGSRP